MNPNTTNNSENLTEDKCTGKAYQHPELALYGSISEITQSVDNMGMGDGGMGMNDRT
jgi:hypothetical protein